MNEINIRIERNSCDRRFTSCDICNELIDDDFVAAGELDDGEKALFCWQCLEKPELIDTQLAKKAECIEKNLPEAIEVLRAETLEGAVRLRSMIGRLRLPENA
jgi:hypothetical protein